MSFRPLVCEFCGTRLDQPARGRPRQFCSDNCRVRASRARNTPAPLIEPLPEVPVDVPFAPRDEQAAQAILEARAVGFTLVRLSREMRPNLSWRLARIGEAILSAISDAFPNLDPPQNGANE